MKVWTWHITTPLTRFTVELQHVEYVSALLKEAGVKCTFLYSQLDPAARKENIARFRNNECTILVVVCPSSPSLSSATNIIQYPFQTDIAARGVDIPLLDVAINFHFPPKPKLFVHRVGKPGLFSGRILA